MNDATSTLAVCLGAGIVTYYINHFTNKGPVFASGIVTLAAGLILPRLFPGNGTVFALAATSASYAGMAARARIRGFVDMTICSVLVAALFILTTNAFVGIGGKLGTIAAIAVLITWGVRRTLEARSEREKSA